LRREDQTPENPFDIRKRFFDLNKQRFCFCEFDADSCSDVYAASHSISKSGSLRLIAERSHVAAIQGDFHFVVGADSFYESLRIVELSINKASTFYGFCSFHDAKHFAQLDRLDFRDPPMFFWQLIYRAAAYEKYRKVVAVDFSDQVRLLDKGARLDQQQRIQFEASFQKWSHGEGLKNLNLLLRSIEVIHERRSYDQISYSYFVTDRRLPFAGVGFFQPSMTMDGKVLQRVNLVFRHELFRSSPLSESVCIAAIPMKSSTLLCLCSLRDQTRSREFIESIHGETRRLVNLFLGAMMLSIENIYFTPSYLETLSDQRMSILKRLSSLGIAEDIKESDIRMARSVTLFDDVSIVERATN
jgi:hypothetical protein